MKKGLSSHLIKSKPKSKSHFVSNRMRLTIDCPCEIAFVKTVTKLGSKQLQHILLLLLVHQILRMRVVAVSFKQENISIEKGLSDVESCLTDLSGCLWKTQSQRTIKFSMV
jgi:hypothetical protein